MSDEALKLVCVGCGSSLSYSASDRALRCPYCGSTTEIPRAEDALPSAVRLIVPLRVELEELEDAVYRYLASGDLTPDHLLDHASIIRKERFYVPAFCFQGRFDATWTASFGYDRTENFQVMETRVVDGRTQSVPVNKTRVATDWRPVSGDDTGDFSVLAYAGSRLSSGGIGVTELFEGQAHGLEGFDSSYISGFEVEEFVHSDSATHASRGKSLIDSEIDSSVRAHAQGDHQKDWHWKADFEWEGVPALVPVCHAIYEFEGRQYAVWFSGWDTGRRVADALPVDAKRHQAIKLGFAPLYATIVASTIAIVGAGSDWGFPLGAVALAWLYGYSRKKAVLSYSKRLRQWLLAKRKGSSPGTPGRPSKPLLANTGSDKVALPLIAVAAAVMAFLPVMMVGRGNHTVSETVAQSTASSSPTSYAPGPAPVAASNQPSGRPRTPPPPSQQATQVATSEPPATVAREPVGAPATAVSLDEAIATLRRSAIVPVLRAAGANDWGVADEQGAQLASHFEKAPRGDRARGRAANAAGLAALSRGDLSGGRAAFERGTTADPSDVELRSNLAYVLVKQNDPAAIGAVSNVLAQAPTRSTAWVNLAEATAADASISSASLKLALRYTPNREKTLGVIRQAADSSDNPTFAGVAASVLAIADAVPTLSDSRSISGATTTKSDVSQGKRPATESPARSDSNLDSVIHQMLVEGEDCYNRKQYTCSITNASNVLRLHPNEPRALKLQMNAQSAQAQAVGSIEIH